MNQLPPALVALISHVELAKSEWWHEALQGSLLVALWSADTLQDVEQLRSTLKNDFGITVDVNEVQEQLNKLMTAGSVMEPEDRRYKVSEEEAEALIRQIEENERDERGTRAHFDAHVSHFISEDDRERVWQLFNERFIVPLIRDTGAKTYGFLEGKPFDIKPTPYLDDFLSSSGYDADTIRAAVVGFLDPTIMSVRHFISNRLTAYFFVQASTRDRALLEQLSKFTAEPARFHVFVDTNLLFSLLHIHVNPADEIAAAIVELQDSLPGLVDLKLYVTPETLGEARHALQRAANNMRGVVLTRAIIEGTSSIRFSGLQQAFIRQASQPNGIRDPEEYYKGLEENLLTLARERGLELYNEDLTPYHTAQRVVDDIATTTEFQNKARARRNLTEKSYEQIRHDVVLWHFVHDKRDVWVEAPLSARYWVVTLEYLFLGFDRYKSRELKLQVPVCLHATVLIQMLQFWLPRAANVESALVHSLRLPVLFYDFDASLERVVIKVLKTISRFEDREVVSPDTIHKLVVNDELRRRLRASTEPDDDFELIRSEVVREAEELRESLRREQEEATRRLGEIGELQSRISELENLAASHAGNLPAIRPSDAVVGASHPLSISHEVTLAVGLGVLAALPVVAAVAWYWLAGQPGLRPLVIGTAILVWFALAGLLAGWLSRSVNSRTCRRAQKLGKWLWIVVVVGILVNLASTLIYERWGRRPSASREAHAVAIYPESSRTDLSRHSEGLPALVAASTTRPK